MKHLRKVLPAVLLAAVTVVAMCIIAFSSPINTTELDTSLAAYTVPNTDAQDLIPVADPTSDKAPADGETTALETPADTEEKKPEEEKKEAEEQKSSSTSVIAVGIVDDDVNLRKKANTQSDILITLSSGTTVSILDKKDGWYQVNYNGQKGYMSADYVVSKTSASDLKGYAKVTTDALNMRSAPDTGSDVVTLVYQDAYVKLKGFDNGWYKVSYDDHTGYMSGDFLDPVAKKPEVSSSSNSSGSGSSSLPSGQSAGEGTGTGADIADFALSFCGVPYVYGGASPSGFDCSGFTMYVYEHFGYSLPHGATPQMNYGSAVSRDNLSVGDLIFFFDSDFADSGASHVGIYIGGGKLVHASSGPGYCVKVSSFKGDSSTGNYYNSVYLTARHIAD